MVTDPDGNAWIDARGEEEADLCLTNFGPSLGGPGGDAWNESIHGGHFFLQEEWSNARRESASRERKPDSVSFAASLGARPCALDVVHRTRPRLRTAASSASSGSSGTVGPRSGAACLTRSRLPAPTG